MLNNWVWANLLPDIGKPYINIKRTGTYIFRLFPSWVNPKRLKWHMDDEDRLISATHPNDWYFQFEDCLPIPLSPESSIFIEKHTWHRLIKGKGPLTIKLQIDE